jgi:hypothetical protein
MYEKLNIAPPQQCEYRSQHDSRSVDLIYRDTIVIMQEKTWAHAFRDTGFGPGQANVHRFILQHLNPDLVFPIPTTFPSAKSLACIFPKNRSNLSHLSHLIQAGPVPKALALPVVIVAPPLGPPPPKAGVVIPPLWMSIDGDRMSAHAKLVTPANIRSDPAPVKRKAKTKALAKPVGIKVAAAKVQHVPKALAKPVSLLAKALARR